MYLVGATRGFISRPFVMRGLRQGLISGLVACLLLGCFLLLCVRYVPQLNSLLDNDMLMLLFTAIVTGGVMIASFSAYVSVSRYLRLKTTDLYV
jgi:cell division transport system permease protein